MSGIEVVAAVSAVISAFHGGSELLKHIKAKRRKTRQALKEFEERQLQQSLESGEQQIGLRYAQDIREFGDLMRVGDVIARDRLQIITIMMQGEVIKSLQMAAQYDNAILNLGLLHEASITNKRDTIVTLDELRQRLALTRTPIPRQLEGRAGQASNRGSITGSTDLLTDNHMPAAVQLPSQDNTKETKQTFASYFKKKRESTASVSSTSGPAPDINFSPALEALAKARGAKDRAVIMQDIDQIIDSYQGLYIGGDGRSSWNSVQWGGASSGSNNPEPSARYFRLASFPEQDPAPGPQSFPPNQQQYGMPNYQHYSPYHQHSPDQQQMQQPYAQYPVARNPYPQMQTQEPRSRYSAVSNTSSVYSDASSLNRNSSTSSQDSHTQSPLPLNIPPRTMGPMNPHYRTPSDPRHQSQDANITPATSYGSPTAMYLQNLSPLSPQRPRVASNASSSQSPTAAYPPNMEAMDMNSLQYSPYATPHSPSQSSQTESPTAESSKQRTSLQEQRNAEAILNRPKYSLLPPVAQRDAPSIKSNKAERSISNSVISATTLGTAPATAGLRHVSVAPSIASTDSGASGSMGNTTNQRNKFGRMGSVQSGGGNQSMMDGRPCRGNNYWGFCKGSWSIREDPKKGLSLRNLPSGMYNTKEIWECSECSFKGTTFAQPHPTKKNKTVTVVNPRVFTSQSGIRYRWIFLAKSHVKKPRQESQADESNYGCILCSVEDKVSSIYGGVETLMNHIALCHVADMSEKTRRKTNCIIGRSAGEKEEWDLNIPVFMEGGDRAGLGQDAAMI